MGKKRNYGAITPEIRAEAVKAMEAGTLSQAEVAEAFGVSTRALRSWKRELEEAEDQGPLSSEEQRAELRQLRLRNKKLEEENAILKKFAAFSASQKK